MLGEPIGPTARIWLDMSYREFRSMTSSLVGRTAAVSGRGERMRASGSSNVFWGGWVVMGLPAMRELLLPPVALAPQSSPGQPMRGRD